MLILFLNKDAATLPFCSFLWNLFFLQYYLKTNKGPQPNSGAQPDWVGPGRSDSGAGRGI